MTDRKSHFPTRAACLLAGVVIGFLLSPIKKGICVHVGVYNGTAGTKKCAWETGCGRGAKKGKESKHETAWH